MMILIAAIFATNFQSSPSARGKHAVQGLSFDAGLSEENLFLSCIPQRADFFYCIC
jgi:hypothetical protein